MPSADVLIVGSGAAALQAAYKLCGTNNVIIFTKATKNDNNSNMAQGGIAAAIAPDDHWQAHYADTLAAGCYYNNAKAVSCLVQQGPREIEELLREGMLFDGGAHGWHLGREGAHGCRRILHAGGDATGAKLLQHMRQRLCGKVHIAEHETVLDLLVKDGVCAGVVTRSRDGRLKHYYAPHTILAAGGAGALYTFTSNHSTITGDGLALAYRAGCELVDLEFMQFHPTMLFIEGRAVGLISEAVRGEGAVLVNSKGARFMDGVHEQRDLAPRDVVARCIHEQMLQGEQVYLDISNIADFPGRFPTITAMCRQHGLSLEAGLLPVVPGAHFLMGGIRVDLDGATNIKGLYAAGEAACNGVHGANRLASNSLLEGLVFGARLGTYIAAMPPQPDVPGITVDACRIPELLPARADLQHMMMKHAGIVREEKTLLQAKSWLGRCLHGPQRTVPYAALTNEEAVVYNMLTVAYLMVEAALRRTVSIGSHYRLDGAPAAGPLPPIVLTKQNKLQFT